MVLGLSAFSATFGLVVIFFVAFPVLAHALIGIAVAQSLAEKAENEAFADGSVADDVRV